MAHANFHYSVSCRVPELIVVACLRAIAFEVQRVEAELQIFRPAEQARRNGKRRIRRSFTSRNLSDAWRSSIVLLEYSREIGHCSQ